MAQHDVIPFRPHLHRPRLGAVRVVPPEPPHGGGTYEVRLTLTRELTVHEKRVLPRLARGLQVTGRELTVRDTTLERVAERAGELTELLREVEAEGRRAEREVRGQAQRFAVSRERERQRLGDLARSIEFPS